MVNFSNISRLAFDGETKVDLVLHELEGQPILKVVPATDANKDLLNYVLKNSQRLSKLSRQRMDIDTLQKTRDQDRETYSRFVIKGWDDIVDASGQPVPFTQVNCEEFLKALPDFIFDRIRQFCTTATNFMNVDSDEPAAPADPGN
jgi:hypothetical protein